MLLQSHIDEAQKAMDAAEAAAGMQGLSKYAFESYMYWQNVRAGFLQALSRIEGRYRWYPELMDHLDQQASE